MGLDIGQQHDPAALAVLQSTGRLRTDSHRPVWEALEVGNIALGTEYEQVAALAVDLAEEFRASGYPVVLTVDATGLGGPVLEMARKRARKRAAEEHRPEDELHIVGLTIGGGRVLTFHGPDAYTVGKHRLTEMLQVALEQHGLLIPDTPGGQALGEQIRTFVRKVGPTGYAKHEAAGSGHDDLVLATELALWTGDTLYDQQAGVAL